jgi:hypothetical protein
VDWIWLSAGDGAEHMVRILRFTYIFRSPEVKAFILGHYGRYLMRVW